MWTEPTARYDTEPGNSRSSWNVTFRAQYTEFIPCGSTETHQVFLALHLPDSAAMRDACHWAMLWTMPSSFPTTQTLIWATFATYNSDLLVCWYEDHTQLDSLPARIDHSLGKDFTQVMTRLGSSKNSCWTLVRRRTEQKKNVLSLPRIFTRHYVIISLFRYFDTNCA